MEFLEGEVLEARLERDGLSIAEIADLGAQIADALEAAHAKGIIHRDIKPANVSLGTGGRIKILDFGLAKHLAGAEGAAHLDTSSMESTQAGVLLGTPFYMSPEQALARPVDHRSDLFSLGALLYKCITGRVPFAGESVGEVLERLLNAQPEAMARFNYTLPAELERIVRKCLEKSPDMRYQSARELSLDLKALQRDLETTPVSTFPPAIASEMPPVEEVKQADVFLSYANVDDQPLVTGRQGWISQLQRNLKVRLEQLSGEEVRI
jgi:serine/threonine protein kinase